MEENVSEEAAVSSSFCDDDTLYCIVSYLDIISLFRFMHSSKHISSRIVQNYSLWRQHYDYFKPFRLQACKTAAVEQELYGEVRLIVSELSIFLALSLSKDVTAALTADDSSSLHRCFTSVCQLIRSSQALEVL